MFGMHACISRIFICIKFIHIRFMHMSFDVMVTFIIDDS